MSESIANASSHAAGAEKADDSAIILASNIAKVYAEGKNALSVFENINFCLRPAETVAILGSSGAGKSTLLNILGGLDRPSSGSVVLCGHRLDKSSHAQLSALRNRYLGFVYQFHHLLAEFSALENVAMPLYIAGMSKREAHARALDLLNQVGLSGRIRHRPAALSGGERQRVAIARALVTQPKCVLMDEPTGNLDDNTAGKIQALMMGLKASMRTSFVVVTHDVALARRMDRVLQLESGALHEARV